MKPIKPITDKSFKYTSAAATDIRKTFAKARKALAAQQAQASAPRNAEPYVYPVHAEKYPFAA